MEVDPNLRKMIMSQDRLNVGFRSLVIKDYIVVSTCNKCHDLGHIMKYCPQKEQLCGHCGKDTHPSGECPVKERPKACIPCAKRGK